MHHVFCDINPGYHELSELTLWNIVFFNILHMAVFIEATETC